LTKDETNIGRSASEMRCSNEIGRISTGDTVL
jgi:hypothetical protein